MALRHNYQKFKQCNRSQWPRDFKRIQNVHNHVKNPRPSMARVPSYLMFLVEMVLIGVPLLLTIAVFWFAEYVVGKQYPTPQHSQIFFHWFAVCRGVSSIHAGKLRRVESWKKKHGWRNSLRFVMVGLMPQAQGSSSHKCLKYHFRLQFI